MFWDIDDDGMMEDIKVWYERAHNVLLRAEYNNLGVRPLACFKYIPYTGKETAGRGIGQMTAGLQDASDALFNMGINSTYISSLQMFATPEDSGIGPREDFYPFKQIPMVNPRDFVPITFPNTLLPNLQMMGYIQQLSDRSSGATNALSGYPDTHAKSRATASGTMFLAQQSSRVFNAIVKGVEETFAEIGAFIFFQLVQNRERLKFEQFPLEKGMRLEEILRREPEELPMQFKFRIATTDADQTEEAKRQRLLTMSQLYSMFGQQTLSLLQNFLQTAGQFAQPMVPFIIEKIKEFTLTLLSGGTKMMENILKEFETPPEGYLPNVKDIQMMLEMINHLREQQYGQRRINQPGGTMQGPRPPGYQGNAGAVGGSQVPPNVPPSGGQV